MLQVLEVVHAGVSKVLNNKAESLSHPVRKMTRMLTNQQAEAYLTAPKDTSNTRHALGQRTDLRESGSSSSTSYSSLAAGDFYCEEAARSDPQQCLELMPSPRARPASRGQAGFSSNSGSVSDPGVMPSLSGAGVANGAAPDLAIHHVRNAISNPGDGPEIVSSDEGRDSGGSDAKMQPVGVAGGKGVHSDAPGVVALIGPLHNVLDNRALKGK